MPETVQLSDDAYDQVGADAAGTEMLTKAEAEAIATKLNHAVNLPLLNEEREQVVFVKIVKLIDRFLYSVLPNEIYELIRIASDGIQAHDAPVIEENLTQLAADNINIPFLSKTQEETVFRVVMGVIVRAMLKDRTIDDA